MNFGVILMRARPCQEITSFAAEMVAQAYLRNRAVYGRFNQHTLVARPGMTRRDVMKPWDDAARRSYFGEQ
jgi:hypothetical protein